ncbi:MAG: hypothetical protein CVV56_01595 [Tenericutes bacterium HGW-Tenericutes-1]|jgi:uncharacterized membrane protein|nr:MAG: hypothetical protein CVV56_01595 [Tenericutes bacterium HGW-Tenericutes-1]
MTKYVRFITLGVLFVAFFVIVSIFDASSIKINQYDAVITIDSEGDMHVSETWDMEYLEALSVRFRDIKFNKYPEGYPLTKSAQNVATFDETNVAVRVWKDGQEITNNVEIGYSFNGDYDELGDLITCYPYSSSCESLFVNFGPDQMVGDIKFQYDYTINGVITEYSDISELNWVLFDYMEADIDEAHVLVNLPANAYTTEELYVWGHGLSDGTIEIVDNHTIEMTINKIKTEEMLEFRILTPTSLYPTLRSVNRFIHPDMNLEVISNYEENLAIETNRRIIIAQFVYYTSIAMLFGMAFIIYYVYKKYDKEYTPDFQGEYFRDLPSDETPAEMSYLYYMKKTNDEDFTATLLDLIRRKYIVLDYNPNELSTSNPDFTFELVKEKDQSELLEHEKFLIDWIFRKIGDGTRVSIAKIEGYGKGNVTKAEQFQASARQFVRSIKRVADKRPYFESGISESKSKAMIFIIIPIVMLLVSLWTQSVYTLNNIVAIVISIVVTAIYGIYVSTIQKRSRYGNELYAKWKAFRNFLLDFSNMKDYPIPGIIVWEHYLVYATSLKIADKVMDQLKVKLPQIASEESEGTFLNTRYRSRDFFWGYALGRFNRSFSTAKANSFQTIAAHNAAKVSSGGRGGSFGGGSSFGGGGGGGRSR